MNILKARNGYRLYNGSTVATEVALAYNADPSVWKEITEEEALNIQEQERLAYEAEERARNGR